MDSSTPILPAHIEDTIRSIADLHADHHRNATAYQRSVDALTARIGNPRALAAVIGAVVLWIVLNASLTAFHREALDPAPYPWLQGLIALLALLVTVLILTTQRRENELSEHRAQLTLEIALITEHKLAKLIAIMVEQRADSPFLRDRHDAEALEMSVPVDPQAALDAIKESHRAAEIIDGSLNDAMP